jgi:hypothetical protein
MSTVSITPSTGALGITGQPLAIHSDTHAHPWLPPIEQTPSGVNYDQSVQFTADQFEIAMNDSRAYLDRVEFAALAAGLLDPYLNPDLVDLIVGDKSGVIDEIELHCVDKSRISVVRGRDAAAYAADSTVNVVFRVANGTLPPVQPTTIPGFPLIPIIPGVTVPQYLTGAWRASDIAKELCRRVGLTCLWQTYDYLMREDTTVNGPILSTIQSLIAPFSHFENAKVDIWAEGLTLIIRTRGAMMAAGISGAHNFAGPGVSLTAHDARISNLVIRAKFNGFIRILKLTGSRTGTSPFVEVDPGTRTTETTDETLNPKTGDVTARTVTTRVTRIKDNACLSEVVETFRDAFLSVGTAGQFILLPMHPVARETTVSNWDDLELGFPNVILNKPKENSRVTTTDIFDPNGGSSAALGVLTPQKRTMIMNSYDAEGYIRMQDTRKENWDLLPGSTGLGKTWVLAKMETKKYDRNGAGMYQITTTQYGADGVAGDSHRTVANGTPPGGPGRGMPSNAAFTGTPISYGILISQEPAAKDITIDNPNLLLSDLLVIAQQAKDNSGSTEVSITFTAAGMPWIRRGMYLTLTDLFAEDGTTPIPLPASLITDARVEYREDSEEPTYDTYVTAVFWEKGRP